LGKYIIIDNETLRQVDIMSTPYKIKIVHHNLSKLYIALRGDKALSITHF